jgi:hypothetical protein
MATIGPPTVTYLESGVSVWTHMLNRDTVSISRPLRGARAVMTRSSPPGSYAYQTKRREAPVRARRC